MSHTHRVDYYSPIKEGNLAIWDNTDGLWEGILLTELRQWEKDNTVWSHLYVESAKAQLNGSYQELEGRGMRWCWSKGLNFHL